MLSDDLKEEDEAARRWEGSLFEIEAEVVTIERIPPRADLFIVIATFENRWAIPSKLYSRLPVNSSEKARELAKEHLSGAWQNVRVVRIPGEGGDG